MKKVNLLFFLLLQTLIFAQGPSNNSRSKSFNLDHTGLAIQGYDPVSYFAGSAKKGSPNFSLKHNGVIYRFISAKNLELFKATPSKYEPMYGGWCAYAMGATGEKVEVDPETFKILNGKLYLFYNAFFNNTLPKWNKDEKNLMKKADENWMIIFK
jgi:YHS domain-containing protein